MAHWRCARAACGAYSSNCKGRARVSARNGANGTHSKLKRLAALREAEREAAAQAEAAGEGSPVRADKKEGEAHDNVQIVAA